MGVAGICNLGGRGSMGVTLWFKWAWSNSWQSNVDADFGHLFVILRVYYMLLVLMLFLFPKICVKF